MCNLNTVCVLNAGKRGVQPAVACNVRRSAEELESGGGVHDRQGFHPIVPGGLGVLPSSTQARQLATAPVLKPVNDPSVFSFLFARNVNKGTHVEISTRVTLMVLVLLPCLFGGGRGEILINRRKFLRAIYRGELEVSLEFE